MKAGRKQVEVVEHVGLDEQAISEWTRLWLTTMHMECWQIHFQGSRPAGLRSCLCKGEAPAATADMSCFVS